MTREQEKEKLRKESTFAQLMVKRTQCKMMKVWMVPAGNGNATGLPLNVFSCCLPLVSAAAVVVVEHTENNLTTDN